MTSDTVALIGFQDRENLGLGYLAAVLERAGHHAAILDFRTGTQSLREQIVQMRPLVVGLSIIFQYYTDEFAQLTHDLRASGIDCLFCAGGHYPSLRPGEVLRRIPELDCVVRFEGEHTLLELAERLKHHLDWHDLSGIAFVNDTGGVIENPLRPLLDDLDDLPFPIRSGPPQTCVGIPMATILASRGCVRDCSFCSIRRFYATPPGRLRRTRRPMQVVDEMYSLHQTHGTRIFLFQDDDFALTSRRNRDWVHSFVGCLKQRHLDHSFLWKISCRADEIDPALLSELQSVGLGFVYTGIESGNAVGLQILNKQITVEQNRKAIDTLRHLHIEYDFGFMLFDPYSTFESVLQNIRFLREVCPDGSTAIPFCKMLPYAGTEIESVLKREGRLSGDNTRPDYCFLDHRLDEWFSYLQMVLEPWAFGPASQLSRLDAARFELGVFRHFCPSLSNLEQYARAIQDITARYNHGFCSIVEESASLFTLEGRHVEMQLAALESAATRACEALSHELDGRRVEYLEAHSVDFCNELAMRKVFTATSCSRDGSV